MMQTTPWKMSARPPYTVVEARLRVAADALIEAGVLAVGWPIWRDTLRDDLDLIVRLDGIDEEQAGQLLERVVRHPVVPLTEFTNYQALGIALPDIVRWTGTVMGAWIFRLPEEE